MALMLKCLLKCILMVCLCSLLLACSVAAQPLRLSPSAGTVLPLFQPILPTLQRQTQVPILLPTRIPTDALVPNLEGKSSTYIAVPITADGQFQRVYSHLLEAQPDRYEIALDATSTCQGQDSCSFGLLSGQHLHPDDPSIPQEYAFEQAPDFQPIGRSPERMEEVALARGIRGHFIPFVCGATCDTSKIIWEQNSYRYKVGIRYAAKATVMNLANSAIQNEQQ
jgi:hypothetical protein